MNSKTQEQQGKSAPFQKRFAFLYDQFISHLYKEIQKHGKRADVIS